MQSVIQGQYFLMDRTLKSVNFFNSTITSSETCVYEVFRIEQTHPLFFEDHIERLENSINASGHTPPFEISQIAKRLNLLYNMNDISDGNVKLDFRFHANGEVVFMAYFILNSYPNEEEKTNGIACTLQFSERALPTAKVYNAVVRGKANTIIEQRQVYESLLVNKDNCLTEGSRSNLFFIKDDTLITASDSLVLGGIMRKQVLAIAEADGITIQYKSLDIDELNEMDAAFITGTSPRMLAIKQIDKVHFPADNALFLDLRQKLEQRILSQL